MPVKSISVSAKPYQYINNNSLNVGKKYPVIATKDAVWISVFTKSEKALN